MKKSLLSLLISCAFLLSSCNEKDTQALREKLKQAEQTITQLNQDLAKSQQDLTALQTQIPALNVEIEPLFSKLEQIKLPVGNDFGRTESELYYFTSIAKTGLDWLDNLLIRNTLLSNDGKVNNQVTGMEREEALKLIEKNYQDSKATLQEYGDIAIRDSSQITYVGQRDNIATFIQYWDSYTGGAHDLYSTNYLNVDLNKKTMISLDSLMSKAHQEQAKAILWNCYLEKRMEAQDAKAEPFISEADFDLVDNFYFSREGINFVYPVYALAPFAEGEVTLTLYWNDANKLVSTDYQRTKKDGVGLAPKDD